MITTFTASVVFSAETQKDVDVSSTLADATESIPCLYDSSNNIVNFQITAIDTATLRISSEFAISGTYRLVALGPALVIPPTPSPVAASFSPPSVRQLKTYADLKAKISVDIDILDETFVTPNELIGYFNEGIEEAESEILKIDEDYFLTQYPIPLVSGQSAYDYPTNIYGYKERGIVYSNNTQIYDVRRFRRNNKFENMAFATQYSQSDDYRWFHTNASGGQAKINLIPPSREDAIVSPNANPFTPMILWYIRHANRIPLLGEYLLNWDVVVQATAIDTGTNRITVAGSYATGDLIKLTTTDTLPATLTANTVYYVIAGIGYIKLATTLQNARLGTAISLPDVGLGVMSISIAANQTIVDNTIIDIPEFTKFIIQWAKCRCMEKEGDRRLPGAAKTLDQQREQMVSTLTEVQQDDDNQIERDMSIYNEMS